MRDQDAMELAWLAIGLVVVLTLVLVVTGCQSARHEFAVEANRRGDVVAAYRVEGVR